MQGHKAVLIFRWVRVVRRRAHQRVHVGAAAGAQVTTVEALVAVKISAARPEDAGVEAQTAFIEGV